MVLHRYTPAFMDSEPVNVEFADTEALRAIPWVKRFEEQQFNGHAFSGFRRDGDARRDILMAVYGNNDAWLVVGFTEAGELERIGLLNWQRPKARTPVS